MSDTGRQSFTDKAGAAIKVLPFSLPLLVSFADHPIARLPEIHHGALWRQSEGNW